MFIPKNVSFHRTLSGFVPIAITTDNNKAIGLLMGTKSFFCGLGL